MNTIDSMMEALQVKADRAWLDMLNAGNCLAYDVTFRADNPNSSSHDKATPQLTRRLKAKYLAAVTTHDEARAEIVKYRAAHA